MTMSTTPAAVAGDWVQIHDVVLEPHERTGHIPDDTRAVPLESWVKGTLVEDSAEIGDTVTVHTMCGRTVTGDLVAVNPGYHYGFGEEYVPELLGIGRQVRAIVKEAQR